MPDEGEYIVPKKGRLIGEAYVKTPVLRADATDDDLGTEPFEDDPEYATGGIIEPMPVKLVCPVCGLESCGHNLEYVEAQ